MLLGVNTWNCGWFAHLLMLVNILFQFKLFSLAMLKSAKMYTLFRAALFYAINFVMILIL